MNSHISYVLQQFKNFLESKGVLVHWQYLIIASMLSLFGGISWAYIGILSNSEFGLFSAVLGLIQGFLAFIYMREKGEPLLIFYSIFFALFSFFLGKYLLYVHYYDWVLSGVVDKEQLSFSLLFFYIKAIDISSIAQFFSFFKQTYSWFDIFLIVVIIASGMEYQLLFPRLNQTNQNSQKRNGRRIKRRFTGQKY